MFRVYHRGPAIAVCLIYVLSSLVPIIFFFFALPWWLSAVHFGPTTSSSHTMLSWSMVGRSPLNPRRGFPEACCARHGIWGYKPLGLLDYPSVQSEGRGCIFAQPDSLGMLFEKVHGLLTDRWLRLMLLIMDTTLSGTTVLQSVLKSRKSILVNLLSSSRFSRWCARQAWWHLVHWLGMQTDK